MCLNNRESLEMADSTGNILLARGLNSSRVGFFV